MKSLGIFMMAFLSGAVMTRCTAHDRQVADDAAHEICRVIEYNDGARAILYASADAGDPSLVPFAKLLDDLGRRARALRDGGTD